MTDKTNSDPVAERTAGECEKALTYIGEDNSKRRFNAYYYSFEPTGYEPIDAILSAVACAGKGYHNTDGWNDPLEMDEAEHLSYIDIIQLMANRAATKAPRTPQPNRRITMSKDRKIVEFEITGRISEGFMGTYLKGKATPVYADSSADEVYLPAHNECAICRKHFNYDLGASPCRDCQEGMNKPSLPPESLAQVVERLLKTADEGWNPNLSPSKQYSVWNTHLKSALARHKEEQEVIDTLMWKALNAIGPMRNADVDSRYIDELSKPAERLNSLRAESVAAEKKPQVHEDVCAILHLKDFDPDDWAFLCDKLGFRTDPSELYPDAITFIDIKPNRINGQPAPESGLHTGAFVKREAPRFPTVDCRVTDEERGIDEDLDPAKELAEAVRAHEKWFDYPKSGQTEYHHRMYDALQAYDKSQESTDE